MGNFEFDFTVAGVRTLVDHGIRISIDLPQGAVETMAILTACYNSGILLHAEITETEKQRDDRPKNRGYNKAE